MNHSTTTSASCRLLLLLLCATLISGCATPVRTGSHCVVGPDYLGNTATYDWHTETAVTIHDETGYAGPTVRDLVRRAAAEQLRRRGFTRVPASTDPQSGMTVALSLTIRRELYPLSSLDPCTGTDCWHQPQSNLTAKLRTVGYLAADVYVDGIAIWRGWVERTLLPGERDTPEQAIADAMPRLFETFPP